MRFSSCRLRNESGNSGNLMLGFDLSSLWHMSANEYRSRSDDDKISWPKRSVDSIYPSKERYICPHLIGQNHQPASNSTGRTQEKLPTRSPVNVNLSRQSETHFQLTWPTQTTDSPPSPLSLSSSSSSSFWLHGNEGKPRRWFSTCDVLWVQPFVFFMYFLGQEIAYRPKWGENEG